LGSQVLPPSASKAQWVAGSSVEVAWGIRFNHGGGYQYRLCPVGQPATEECFQRLPLEFDRTKQTLLWNNGTRYPIKGVFVDTGVVPQGSTWARNPIPRVNDDNRGLQDPTSCLGPNGRSGPGCIQFPPPCPFDTGLYDWSTDGSGQGECSGDWTMGLIADTLIIPENLRGDYVLSWRWDCEETAQIWQNCADVHITTASTTCGTNREEDMNYDGDDIPNKPDGSHQPYSSASTDDCCARCGEESKCSYWTWSSHDMKCWLKSGMGTRTQQKGIVSGNVNFSRLTV